jgi:hypothetical protein
VQASRFQVEHSVLLVLSVNSLSAFLGRKNAAEAIKMNGLVSLDMLFCSFHLQNFLRVGCF